MMPPLIFLAVNKPEDVNLMPDGIKSEVSENNKNQIYGLTLDEALKEKCFYILAFSFFSISTKPNPLIPGESITRLFLSISYI